MITKGVITSIIGSSSNTAHQKCLIIKDHKQFCNKVRLLFDKLITLFMSLEHFPHGHFVDLMLLFFYPIHIDNLSNVRVVSV